MALHVMDEANHCLGCKNPRCQQGCPIHTNIPEVIRLLKANQLNEAGRMLFENNPLTTVCSLICNHEKQCEGHCVRGIKGAPVHFSVIENYISSTYASQMTRGPAKPNGKRVAIIGSGPAGLTIAVILARYGYDVTIFESHDKIGGVLRYGIPEFRLPKTVLDDFEYRHLRLKDIKVRPNTDVGKALRIDDLLRDGYKAIFIGTGVWRPNTLKIKGESLGHVHYAINYLQNPDVYHLGERVIIIGAGNAAMDVARTAIRHGSRHVQCFSLTRKITASDYEASYAKLEGVDFIYNKKPVEITDRGVVFRDVLEAEDGSLTDVAGSEMLYPANSVIVSISQGACTTITESTDGLQVNPRGLFVTDEVGRTSRPGIFASGDAVKGARTVVEAVAYSKTVAEAMHEYMQSLPVDGPDEYADVPVFQNDDGN
ncbi:MAG: NAD(P)-dependent oxidoreductase [Gemmiger sp.]